MSTFGELVLETSRAFPDDEEEAEYGVPPCRIRFEAAAGAAELLKGIQSSNASLYFFEGKVARGFGDGFVNDEFLAVGEVHLAGVDGTVDSLLNRPGQRAILKLYHNKASDVIFALVDTYGLPRSLSSDVIRAVAEFIEAAKKVVIFHSEPLVSYRGKKDVQGELFHLKSSTVQPDASILKHTKVLPQPNIISGVSAAVLTECESAGKDGLLLVTYCETDSVDSISMKPFFEALEKGKQGSININQDFAHLTHNPSRSYKSNITPLADSNLYI